MAVAPQQRSWDEMLKALHEAFTDVDYVDVNIASEILTSYKSNEEDWKKYDQYDPDNLKGYTRNLIDAGNKKFNVMLLHWHPGQGSPIHDHSGAECTMFVLSGTLKETRYPNQKGEENKPIDGGEVLVFHRDEITHMNDSVGLHKVENPSDHEPLITLHLYYPPYDSCRKFDKDTGAAKKSLMPYYSMFGKKC